MCADGTQRLGCRTNDWVHVFHIRRKFRSRVVINVNVSGLRHTGGKEDSVRAEEGKEGD